MVQEAQINIQTSINALYKYLLIPINVILLMFNMFTMLSRNETTV